MAKKLKKNVKAVQKLRDGIYDLDLLLHDVIDKPVDLESQADVLVYWLEDSE
jgi:hypothetical protein